jgi:signal peptidase II
VAGPLALAERGPIAVTGFFNLRWTQNLGVSLGLFSASSSEGKLALLAMTGLIALGVFVWMLREKVLGELLALALVLGGALGNIYDRWTRGYVIDYADLHFGEFRPFLIFNLADAAITLGVLILLARSLFRAKSAHRAAQPYGDLLMRKAAALAFLVSAGSLLAACSSNSSLFNRAPR